MGQSQTARAWDEESGRQFIFCFIKPPFSLAADRAATALHYIYGPFFIQGWRAEGAGRDAGRGGGRRELGVMQGGEEGGVG